MLPHAVLAVVSPCTVEPDYTAPRPVVNVHVPSFCECGATVVGVWYNKKPYYCQWFRHNRYAALRKLLEQNRCKSKHVSDRGRASELFTTLNIGSSDVSRASSGDISSRASSGELPRVPSSDVVSSSDSRFSSGEFGPSEQPTFGVGMLEPDSKRVLVAAGARHMRVAALVHIIIRSLLLQTLSSRRHTMPPHPALVVR